MDLLPIQRLHCLKEAYTNRLRQLELPSAQYGIDCPAHFAAEIKLIKEQISNIN